MGPLGLGLAAARTHALFKARDLEVIRLVLLRGQSLPMHRVQGEITVHCLEGRIEVTTATAVHGLLAGQLLYLPGGVDHDVHGIEDASALVTIALR